MIDFGSFHFLRPAWLLCLPAVALLSWLALRSANPRERWRGLIEPALLDALLLPPGKDQGRLKPGWLVGPLLLLSLLALAGPSWEQQPTPFAEDQAAVMLVVQVTPSMRAQDIQPSRLERTVQKIEDFLALKPGQRAGLIAYAGSAHLAMPLTRDPEVLLTFARALEPEAMPVEGNKLPNAVALARQRLSRAGVPGSVVLFADRVDEGQLATLRAESSRGSAPVHVVAMAAGPELIPPPGSPPAAPLDAERMRELARVGGGELIRLTADDADMRQLAAAVERGINSAPAGDQQQWRDAGYWFLPLLLLVLLPFFRRGGGLVRP